MSNVFFTADTHFGHKKMVQFRPWTSVEEMNEGLIEKWNLEVRPGDRVYHLGDFSFVGSIATRAIIANRLRGQIHLIRGNHDKSLSRNVLDEFESVSDYKEIKLDGIKICMSHYPMMSWNCMAHGSWMLHGHSHGNLAIDSRKRFDVGVDTGWFGLPALRPIAFEEIKESVMDHKTFEPVDHHGAEA